MKRVYTKAEYDALVQSSMAIPEYPSSGSGGHIEDHKKIIDALFLTFFNCETLHMEKMPNGMWGSAQGEGSSEQVATFFDEEVLEQLGNIAVIDHNEILSSIDDYPEYTRVSLYSTGMMGFYNNIEMLKKELSENAAAVKPFGRISNVLSSMLDCYVYDSYGNGWTKISGPLEDPFPMDGIVDVWRFDGAGGFINQYTDPDLTIQSESELSTIAGMGVTRIAIWQKKFDPAITDVTARIETLEDSNGTLSTTVSDLEADVSALTADKETLEGKVSTLESDNSTLNSTVSTLEGNVTTLTSDKEALEGQVSTLESTVSDLAARLEALENPASP